MKESIKMDEIQFRSIMLQHGQEKILDSFAKMSGDEKSRLLKQCDSLDFSFLNALKNNPYHEAFRDRREQGKI